MITALLITTIIILWGISGWIAYLYLLKIVQLRNNEREQYQQSLQFMEVRYQEGLREQTEQYAGEIRRVEDHAREAHAVGKNEGKRIVLDWIKRSVDEGTLEVRVIGSPVKKPSGVPAPVTHQ